MSSSGENSLFVPQDTAPNPDDAAPDPQSNNPERGRKRRAADVENEDDDLIFVGVGPAMPVFQWGTHKERISKDKVLDEVRKRSIEVFGRQAKTTLNKEAKDALVNAAHLCKTMSKTMILRRYEEYWSDMLDECVKSQAAELTTHRKRAITSMLPKETVSYTEDYVRPRQTRLEQAKEDVQMMEALILFLKGN